MESPSQHMPRSRLDRIKYPTNASSIPPFLHERQVQHRWTCLCKGTGFVEPDTPYPPQPLKRSSRTKNNPTAGRSCKPTPKTERNSKPDGTWAGNQYNRQCTVNGNFPSPPYPPPPTGQKSSDDYKKNKPSGKPLGEGHRSAFLQSVSSRADRTDESIQDPVCLTLANLNIKLRIDTDHPRAHLISHSNDFRYGRPVQDAGSHPA